LTINDFRGYRKVPVDRLEKRLEVDKYQSIAGLCDFNAKISEIKLYLSQHVGAPSVPVVRTGEKVAEGQLVADICEGKLGAKIHSSISGTVSEITDSYIIIKE
jgi:Na+-translocating ferredoxin:NAD+ oxidoreductase RnfC subunit